jgi:hypothetical protein
LESFSFANIGSQTVDVAFSITITAQDAYGNTVTSYTGTNTLSASAGLIDPTVTTAFSGGVWIGSVTLDTANEAMTIHTVGTNGKFGDSAPFVVVSEISKTSVQILVSSADEVKVRLNYQSNTINPISSGVQVGELLAGAGDRPTPIVVLVASPINLPTYHSTGYYQIDYTPAASLAPGHYQVWFLLWNEMPSAGGGHSYMAKVVVEFDIT